MVNLLKDSKTGVIEELKDLKELKSLNEYDYVKIQERGTYN